MDRRSGRLRRTGKQWRFVDAFDAASGIARESKVGRVSATSFTKAQIQKDVQLLLDGAVDKVEWLFSTSSKTGKGGYTKGFEKVVNEANETLRAAGKAEIKLVETGKTF